MGADGMKKGPVCLLKTLPFTHSVVRTKTNNHRMATDRNSFIQEPDPEVQADLAKPTKDKLREAQNAFRR